MRGKPRPSRQRRRRSATCRQLRTTDPRWRTVMNRRRKSPEQRRGVEEATCRGQHVSYCSVAVVAIRAGPPWQVPLPHASPLRAGLPSLHVAVLRGMDAAGNRVARIVGAGVAIATVRCRTGLQPPPQIVAERACLPSLHGEVFGVGSSRSGGCRNRWLQNSVAAGQRRPGANAAEADVVGRTELPSCTARLLVAVCMQRCREAEILRAGVPVGAGQRRVEAARHGIAGIGRTGVAVAAGQGWSAVTGAAAAGVAGRAGVAVVARSGVRDVDAPGRRVARIVRADVVVAAGQGWSAVTGAAPAGVAGRAGIAVVARSRVRGVDAADAELQESSCRRCLVAKPGCECTRSWDCRIVGARVPIPQARHVAVAGPAAAGVAGRAGVAVLHEAVFGHGRTGRGLQESLCKRCCRRRPAPVAVEVPPPQVSPSCRRCRRCRSGVRGMDTRTRVRNRSCRRCCRRRPAPVRRCRCRRRRCRRSCRRCRRCTARRRFRRRGKRPLRRIPGPRSRSVPRSRSGSRPRAVKYCAAAAWRPT